MPATVEHGCPAMLHWIYPETCLLCGEPCTGTLCESCRSGLQRVPRPICLYCGAPVTGAQETPYRCAECAALPRPFDFARASLCVSENALRLIHDLKYHGALYLARALAPLLAELWQETPQLRAHRDWALIPVPITAAKLRKRGYNQAAELARELAPLVGSPAVIEALERHETGIVSQTRLSKEQRRTNARMAYHTRAAYAAGKRTLPPHLLLVDDVFTTGSTARACAAALKKLRGVQTVGVLTLLHVD